MSAAANGHSALHRSIPRAAAFAKRAARYTANRSYSSRALRPMFSQP